MFLFRPSSVLSLAVTTTPTIFLQPSLREFNFIRSIPKISHRQHRLPIGRPTVGPFVMFASDNTIPSIDGSDPSAVTSTKTTTTIPKKQIVVDPFCYRQFREFYQDSRTKSEAKDYTGTIFDISISEFERIVNERYISHDMLKDGYAPFCKHLFIQNDFTNAVVNVLPITNENEHLLRTKYVARNEKELPVLIRYFPKELIITPNQSLPIAKYLDLILYSREQINLENQATQAKDDTASTTTTSDQTITTETAPWGIVSIKAQDIDTELPMTPITNMRNALGKEYGGSGIPLEYEKYMECINYWKDHATISLRN